ncbi:hypothetical protein AMR41_05795 [Hapalosiphon sp. MRB220]|nr:hypothetical protein AMR41_05795 [Hapalosiphon sp. MRB220]
MCQQTGKIYTGLFTNSFGFGLCVLKEYYEDKKYRYEIIELIEDKISQIKLLEHLSKINHRKIFVNNDQLKRLLASSGKSFIKIDIVPENIETVIKALINDGNLKPIVNQNLFKLALEKHKIDDYFSPLIGALMLCLNEAKLSKSRKIPVNHSQSYYDLGL